MLTKKSSVGAKSAPAGKVDIPSESEGSGHSDDDSSISSQDSGKFTSGFCSDTHELPVISTAFILKVENSVATCLFSMI